MITEYQHLVVFFPRFFAQRFRKKEKKQKAAPGDPRSFEEDGVHQDQDLQFGQDWREVKTFIELCDDG